jgi:hypothetical protein
MNNKVNRILKEPVLPLFKILFHHLPGETPAGWLGSTLTMRAEENII